MVRISAFTGLAPNVGHRRVVRKEISRIPTARQSRRPRHAVISASWVTTEDAAASSDDRREKTAVHATIIDSRKSAVVEAHHWITVSSLALRMFERAAVAHADMVRRVEKTTATGSLHRWVLRVVDDPFLADAPQSVNSQSRYVVMETYRPGDKDNDGVMRRWLSAIERLGPALSAPVTQTLRYSNLFTSKLHNAKFDVHRSVVMAETFSASNIEESSVIMDILQSHAEESVASGDCLEFCVLEAVDHPGLFKTLEVYKDADSLREHMDKLDVKYWQKLQPLVTNSSSRKRNAFKPVVFS